MLPDPAVPLPASLMALLVSSGRCSLPLYRPGEIGGYCEPQPISTRDRITGPGGD